MTGSSDRLGMARKYRQIGVVLSTCDRDAAEYLLARVIAGFCLGGASPETTFDRLRERAHNLVDSELQIRADAEEIRRAGGEDEAT